MTGDVAAAVVGAIPGPLVLADAAGTIVWANRHASALLGYEPDALAGLSIDALTGRPAHHAHLRGDYMNAPSPRVFGKGRFLQARRRDGSRFPVEIALQPVSLHGSRHVLALLRDVSERQRLAEQLRRAQKMEALLTLGGSLAHDFQNVLTAIAGGLELLGEHLREPASEGAGDHGDHGDHASLGAEQRLAARRELTAMERATERGRAIASSLLNLSHEPSGSLERADVSALAAETLPLITRLLGSQVKLRARLDPALPAALVDPGALTQALLNLASNARDALAGDGAVMIETRALELSHDEIPAGFDAPPGTFVELTFSDDGPGMSGAVLARAAEPFFTTKPQGRGTGLGLAQVYATALQAGGLLRVESAPGEGTTVRLAFRRT